MARRRASCGRSIHLFIAIAELSSINLKTNFLIRFVRESREGNGNVFSAINYAAAGRFTMQKHARNEISEEILRVLVPFS